MASSSFTTLKTRNDFLNLKIGAKRYFLSDYSMLVFKENEHGYLRVGWTIPGKVEKAFVRNRLKRWMRHYFKSSNQNFLNQAYDLNVIFRKTSKTDLRKLKYQDFKQGLDSFVKDF